VQFNSLEIYSSQTLCSVINFRGVRLFPAAREPGCEKSRACGPRCRTKRENTATYARTRLFSYAQYSLACFWVPTSVSC
jgi:hypothetical protein